MANMGLFLGHRLAEIRLLIGEHHIGIESEHVLIPDAVRDAVAVQLVPEDRRSGVLLLLVLFLNRRSSETKENGPRESVPDCQHHLAECRPVALIDDEHHPFRIDVVNCVRHGAAAGILADTAHLLDRSDNQSVIRAVASQFVQQIGGVFCCLDRLIIGREPLILAKALRAEFDTVHQEDHFIGVT